MRTGPPGRLAARAWLHRAAACSGAGQRVREHGGSRAPHNSSPSSPADADDVDELAEVLSVLVSLLLASLLLLRMVDEGLHESRSCRVQPYGVRACACVRVFTPRMSCTGGGSAGVACALACDIATAG